MDVSIIIVNYNTKELTEKCIKSVFEFTEGLEFEVILVDNKSSDGSIEYFSNYPNIKYIQSNTNIGFGRANNLGYEYCSGEYVFLLNSDTYFLNNALKFFYDSIENLPGNISCLGGYLLEMDERTIGNSYGVFPSIQETLRSLWRIYCKPNYKKSIEIENKPIEVDFISGADLFLRRSVVEKHGLFDPDFFLYYEETQMQLRYSKEGYKQLIIPEPKIVHLEGGSDSGTKKYAFKSKEIFFKSMFLYMKKKYNLNMYFVFRIIALGYLPLQLRGAQSNRDALKFLKLMFNNDIKQNI